MDGLDLLATTPCGLGKSGYLILLMLVVQEIAADKILTIGKEVLEYDVELGYMYRQILAEIEGKPRLKFSPRN